MRGCVIEEIDRGLGREEVLTLIVYPFFDVLAFTEIDKSFEEGEAFNDTRTEFLKSRSGRALNPRKSKKIRAIG